MLTISGYKRVIAELESVIEGTKDPDAIRQYQKAVEFAKKRIEQLLVICN